MNNEIIDNDAENTENGFDAMDDEILDEIMDSADESFSDGDFHEIEDTPELRERRNRAVDRLLELDKFNKRWKKLGEDIYRDYVEYYETRSDSAYYRLYPEMKEYYGPKVRKILIIGCCYSEANFKDAFQECMKAVFESILKDIAKGELRTFFLASCMRIIINQSITFVRKYGVGGRKKPGEPEGGDKPEEKAKKPKKPKANPALTTSLDETKDEGSAPKLEIPTVDINLPEFHEGKKVYGYLLHLYIKEFTELKAFPPTLLALFYADILPHMLHSLKDYKQSSSKQAFGLMQSKTVWQLAAEAEDIMKSCFGSDIHWSAHFTDALGKPSKKIPAGFKLGDVVFTKVFTKKQTDHWASYVHRKVVDSVRKTILNDNALYELVSQYVTGNGVLDSFINDGGNLR